MSDRHHDPFEEAYPRKNKLPPPHPHHKKKPPPDNHHKHHRRHLPPPDNHRRHLPPPDHYRPPPNPYYPPPAHYNPPLPPPPPPPSGCQNGDPNCGRGYMCERCYNGVVQPMGYAGVNHNAPAPQPQYNCQPVWRPWC